MKRLEYYQPRALDDAYTLMERLGQGARYIAGGTDMIVRIRQGAIRPHALISLRGIRELDGISLNNGLCLGGMTIFRDIERHPVISYEYPVLAQAVSVLANPQVRNVATLGGNLCNSAPSADCAPPLLVLEASLFLEGPGGIRSVPVEEFFTGPGQNCLGSTEILKEVRIPEKAPHTGMAFLKIGRLSQDMAIVNAAALLVMDKKICVKCRLSVGAVAPVPLRLKGVEKLVEGQEISPDLLERIGRLVKKEVAPITDVRSTENYRRTVSGVLIKRAISAALENAECGMRNAGPGGYRPGGKAKGKTKGEVTKTCEVQEKGESKDADGQYAGSSTRRVIHFALNGREVAIEVSSHKMALQVLREDFQLTGTKEGCGQGECGACTILIDGANVNSCIYPAFELEGKAVTTIEGLVGEGNILDPIQEAFVEKGGVQCGFCTPGMVMSSKALLDETPRPTDEEIRRGISGNLCRCTGYVQIVDSIRKAAEDLSKNRGV